MAVSYTHLIEQIMEENRVALNDTLPAYSQISKMKIYPEELSIAGTPVATNKSLSICFSVVDWSFAGCSFSFPVSEARAPSIPFERSIVIFFLYG